MSEWQPIETAPKDGTEILGVQQRRPTYPEEPPEYWYFLVKWRGKFFEDHEGFGSGVTHWMPRPEPPK